jgi:hypothetical protein
LKIERPQAGAPWIPSRRRHALFRLAASIQLLRTAVACPVDETKVLAIDRDQSAAETYAVATLVCFTLTCFLAEALSSRMHVVAALILSVPLAVIAINAAVVGVGLLIAPLLHTLGVPRGPHNVHLNSAIMLLPLGLAASYLALSPTWVRVPAWIFLGCLVANGIAAIVFFILRNRVREAEARCVV